MGTIDQPKPSEPKSPQPAQQPLNPGAVPSNPNTTTPQRPNPQTPEDQSDVITPRDRHEK
jgi:hypothetical protein